MNAQQAVPPSLPDNRALLATVSHRKVNRVANEESPYATALFNVVKERQRVWTSAEWAAVLEELDSTAITIGEWLLRERAR